MMRVLWHLKPMMATSVPSEHEQWSTGLRLHLGYQPLTFTLLQWSRQQRSYIITPGCPQCADPHPDPAGSGCRTPLLLQLIQSCWTAADDQTPMITINRRPLGLRPHPYAHYTAIRPTANAEPITGDWLQTLSDDARLILHYQRVGATLYTGVVIATMTRHPRTLALPNGWRRHVLPSALLRPHANRALPSCWPWSALRSPLPATWKPDLLWPVSHADGSDGDDGVEASERKIRFPEAVYAS